MPDSSTLLIVDDCAADRKVYRRFLSKDPHQTYEILEATSAADGLALCQKSHSHAILLDYCLPDMTGLEFLEHLRQFSDLSVPVIMLTGQGDERLAVQAMKQGVHDYLSKQHLQADALQIAVRNVIKRAQLQELLSKTRERQRLIATTALRIRQSLDLEQILHTAVAEVQQLLDCDCVVVYQAGSDPGRDQRLQGARQATAPAAGVPVTGVPAAGVIVTAAQVPSETCCWSNAVPHSLQHFRQTPIPPEDDAAFQGNLIAPIYLTQGSTGENWTEHHPAELWGLLIVHQCEGERQWLAEEREIVNALAVQLAIAIQQAELLSQTQSALIKAKELNAFKAQIVATVAHGYRTPLTSILAAASTLRQNHQRLSQERRDRCLEIIEQKTRSMAQMVNDMLALQQMELNKADFKPLPLDLLQFLVDWIEQQQDQLGATHTLKLQITGNPKGFWGDRGILQQILGNLLSNAIKFSPEGGGITIHLVSDASTVTLEMQDPGIGIPLDDQTNLFQAFSRGSNVDTIPGTGLGLAIVRACVELHGGQVSLESAEGEGTLVKVQLPKRSRP